MIGAADHQFMAQALRLAEHGLYTTDPNPRVGCVLVKNNQVIAEGWHQRAGGPHAEIVALNVLHGQAKDVAAYISLEPCCHHGRTPPCSQALIEAKIKRVVVAMLDPNPLVAGKGLQQLEAAGIHTESGLMRQQAEDLNPGFIRRMRDNRPHVRCKIAMSLDGRTAMANGESQWITGAAARADVHRLRARSSAILTGINTVIADNPSLNVRLESSDASTEVQQPVRVIVDSQLRMPADARMLQLPGKTWIFTCSEDLSRQQALIEAGADIVVVPGEPSNNRVDLQSVLTHLANRGINEVMVEAGATLNGALLQAGLIDELVIYTAAKLMGDGARGAFHLSGIEHMAQCIELEPVDFRKIGNDWRIVYIPSARP